MERKRKKLKERRGM